jgi:hypothetical protein
MGNDKVVSIADLRNGKQTDVHNRIVGDIVRSIVQPPIEAGGSFISVLVVLESVTLGVLLSLQRLEKWSEGETAVFRETLNEAVASRLATAARNDGGRDAG